MVCDAVIRPYEKDDQPGWLRCRALAFLATSYFDDVTAAKPTYRDESVELVAIDEERVVGLIDVTASDGSATIETVAVHPDKGRQGIGSGLLAAALASLRPGAQTVEAWTREDVAANSWYRRSGFRETFRYLHVYASTPDELDRAMTSFRRDLQPVHAMFHADVEDEPALRASFSRVYICRRYQRDMQSL